MYVRVGLGVGTCAGATVGRREGIVVGVVLQLVAVAERHVAAISYSVSPIPLCSKAVHSMIMWTTQNYVTGRRDV
jgi:hypothetical protein